MKAGLTSHIVVVCLSVLILLAGCQEAGESPRDISMQQRRALPAEGVSYLLKAQNAFRQGAYALALVYTDSLEQYNPELTDLHFLRGRIYTGMNRANLAQESYEKALEIDPWYQGARLNLGNVLLRRGKTRDALHVYQEAMERFPSSDVSLQIGRTYAELGIVDSAQTAYETALELDSTNVTAYMWLGQLCEDNGEYEKALNVSREGLELNPENLRYQYLVASQLVRLGENPRAIDYLQPITEAWPWHAGAHYNLGQALIRSGQESLGEDYLTRADSLQKQEERLEELEGLADMNPSEITRWVNLGNAYQKSGRLEEARDAYNIALGIEPWNVAVQTDIATLTKLQGDTLQAIQRYLDILRRNPQYGDVWVNLGVAYAQTGRMKQAREAWKDALKYEPGNSMAKEYLAMTESRK